MRVGWRRSLSEAAWRHLVPRSIRARLFITLMIAGAPGVLFAAVEARRQFDSAMQAVRAQQVSQARSVAAQLDTVFLGANQLLSSLSGVAAVRDLGPTCPQVLREALSAPRYAALARHTAAGMTVCSSTNLPQPVDQSTTSWFQDLRQGSDFAASPLVIGNLSGEEALILATPVRREGVFVGALSVGLRRSWLNAYLENSLQLPRGAALLLDGRGQVVARVGDIAPEDLRPQAPGYGASAAAAQPTNWTGDKKNALNLYRTNLAAPGLSLVVARPEVASAIGWRSALIVLSPLLVAALSLIGVWLALEFGVLRWHAHMAEAARAFADGRPLPKLQGAPPLEMEEQARAFADAVEKARAREAELAEAVEGNLALSRELHHRVKNNLQILSSLASRQQRRVQDPTAKRALAESRAQLLAIALVYRFLHGPEELGAIDLRGYLTELARQLDVVLRGEARDTRLVLEIEPAWASADQVGALGLIVAECFIAAYGGRAAGQPGQARLRWVGKDLEGPWKLEVAGPSGAMARALDLPMIRETARQLKADQVDAADGHIMLARTIAAAAASAPSDLSATR